LIGKESNGPLLRFYDVNIRSQTHKLIKSVEGLPAPAAAALHHYKDKNLIFQGGNEGMVIIDIATQEVIANIPCDGKVGGFSVCDHQEVLNVMAFSKSSGIEIY